MTYATTQRAIMGVKPRSNRHRELVARSDDLLERLERLNLAKYGSIRFNGRSPRLADLEAVRLTSNLVAAVNELLVEVGLDPRRLTTTREALDAVYDAQSVLFGCPRDDDEEETQP